MAIVRFEVGPCDDDAFFYLDGSRVLALRLGEHRVFTRDLRDGAHAMRLIVVNSGAYAWAAKLNVTCGGHTICSIDQAGNTGPAAGTIFNERWDFEIEAGGLRGR